MPLWMNEKINACLIAGSPEKYNAMTIGWISEGFVWRKRVLFVFVKPNRYTYSFMESTENFTVCFFDEKYNNDLLYLGTHSGKNENKIDNTSLHIIKSPLKNGLVFEECNQYFILKKISCLNIDSNFIPEDVKNRYYSEEPIHKVYMGEIIEEGNLCNH